MTAKLGEIEATSGARQIAAYLKNAQASGKKIVPFSAERLKRWRQSAEANVVLLNLEHHEQVLEHPVEDQVVLVETGINLTALDHYLKQTGQWLPLSLRSTSLPLLETIITGDGGALSHSFGGPRRLVLGLTLALSDGSLVRTGGRVVKNVTGYDLTRAIIGSYGMLALPVTAYLRLYARPERFLSVIVAGSDPLRLLAYGRSMERLGLPIVAMEIIDERLLGQGIFSKVKDAQTFLLLVRLAGAGALVEAAGPMLIDVCAGDGPEIEQIGEPEGEESLWSYLTELCQMSDDYPLEFAVTGRVFANLWQEEKDLFAHPFTYGPASGGCKIFLPGLSEQDAAIAKLSAYAQKAAQSLTIAFGDGNYIRCVRRLGPGSSQESKLLSRLKEQFDPANCLNPFVRFEANQ